VALNDLGYALRLAQRSPGFTAVAVLSASMLLARSIIDLGSA